MINTLVTKHSHRTVTQILQKDYQMFQRSIMHAWFQCCDEFQLSKCVNCTPMQLQGSLVHGGLQLFNTVLFL